MNTFKENVWIHSKSLKSADNLETCRNKHEENATPPPHPPLDRHPQRKRLDFKAVCRSATRHAMCILTQHERQLHSHKQNYARRCLKRCFVYPKYLVKLWKGHEHSKNACLSNFSNTTRALYSAPDEQNYDD